MCWTKRLWNDKQHDHEEISNRRLNRKTYCYFADAYTCFDKLWLKDCLVELWRAGMREREVYILYKMTKESHIVIETPVGMTDSIIYSA